MKKKELRKDSLETLMFGGCVEEVYSKETYKESTTKEQETTANWDLEMQD